jgi:hypothetical protein
MSKTVPYQQLLSKSASQLCQVRLQPDEFTAMHLGVAPRWTSIAEGLDAKR